MFPKAIVAIVIPLMDSGKVNRNPSGKGFTILDVIKNIWGWAQWLMPVIPTLWEAEVGGLLEARSLSPAWPTWQSPVSMESMKISWAWWCALLVPATWEAEAGELLEHGRQRLQ